MKISFRKIALSSALLLGIASFSNNSLQAQNPAQDACEAIFTGAGAAIGGSMGGAGGAILGGGAGAVIGDIVCRPLGD